MLTRLSQPDAPLPARQLLSVMSGTSLDGMDALIVRLERPAGQKQLYWQVLARQSLPYPEALRARLQAALNPATSDVVLLTQLHREVGEAYAAGCLALLEAEPSLAVDLIALSGQTVYHIPRADPSRAWYTPSTLQLGEASVVATRCCRPVMADFRQADIAAGGQGAPMVAFGDWQLYQQRGCARAVHNLGGISNLTYLPADASPEGVFAFDTGPANCLLDEAAQHYFQQAYDAEGRLAAQGKVQVELLEHWLRDPYFHSPAPKTTGREAFNLARLQEDSARASLDLHRYQPHDLLATLSALTAESIAQAYADNVVAHGLDEILLAGGGAYNPDLLSRLEQALKRRGVPVSLRTFESLGYQAKDREALSFAVMAYFALFGLPNTLPKATGAAHAVIAGKLSQSPHC